MRNRGTVGIPTSYGMKPWIPPNEIWVMDHPLSPSLKDALEGAGSGEIVRVFPGTYSDTGVTINNAITVYFEPGVTWSGTDTLFTITQDDTRLIGAS